MGGGSKESECTDIQCRSTTLLHVCAYITIYMDNGNPIRYLRAPTVSLAIAIRNLEVSSASSVPGI